MKKILLNYLYNSLYQLLLIVIPLFTTPFLTRTLGKEALGIDSYVLSVVTMAEIIGALGLNTYSSREIAYRKSEGKGCYDTFIELFLMRIFLCVCVCIVYFMFSRHSEYRIYFLIQSITLIAFFLDVSWLFIGLEEMKIVVVFNSAVKLFSTVLIFGFIRSAEDLGLYELIYGSSNALGVIGMLSQVPRYIKRTEKVHLNFRRHVVPVLALFLPQAAISMYAQFDKIMLGKLCSDIAQVSFYDKGEQIVKAPLALITAFTAVVMPRIAAHHIKGNQKEIREIVSKTMNMVLLVFVPMAVGIIMVSDIFVPFYLGRDYQASVRVVQVLSPILIAIGLSNVTGAQYLVATDQTGMLTTSYVSSAVVNICLNSLLIPRYGAVGACIGTVAAESVAFIIQYWTMIQKIGNLHLLANTFKKIVACIIMAVAVYGVRCLLGNGMWSMLLQILVGMAVYFIVLLFERDGDCMYIIEAVGNKWKGFQGRGN